MTTLTLRHMSTRGNPTGEPWYDFDPRKERRARRKRTVTARRRQSVAQRRGKRV